MSNEDAMKPKRKILVVDDEVSYTRLLKLSMEQTNEYSVKAVNWPEDAVPTAKKFKPDLILLDVMMPRMFGGDVATQLRADEDLKNIPIVFLTATMNKETVDEHHGEIKGETFMAKPVSRDELIAYIENHLGGA